MTKKILITLVLIAVIVALIHVALFAFINLKGRDIIVAKLQKDFGADVQLDSISLSFPFAIEIRNFQCGDLSFRRAKASLGIFNPFVGYVISNLYLEDLKVNITLDRKGARVNPIFSKPWRRRRKKVSEETKEKFSLPRQTAKVESDQIEADQAKKKTKRPREFSLIIKNLYIKDGRIQVTNGLRRQTVVTTINNIDAYLKDFSYPKLEKFSCDISGSLKTVEGISRKNVNLKGWVDYPNKNMEVALELNKIDYSAFEAYYPPSWKPEKLGIKEAFLSLDSNFLSLNDELTIKNVLSLDSIKYREPVEGEEGNLLMKNLKTALAIIQGSSDKPSFNFVIKTKMSSPKLSLTSIKESIKATIPFGPALIIQGVADQVKESLKNKLKDSQDISIEDIGDIFKETGEEILDTLKSIFMPKREEAQP